MTIEQQMKQRPKRCNEWICCTEADKLIIGSTDEETNKEKGEYELNPQYNWSEIDDNVERDDYNDDVEV